MMDEEIRQALCEVREMKKMCGNINMKLTNIVTQRGQDIKKKLEAEYQRGLEHGKAVNDKGCEGCKYERKLGMTPCAECCNSYKNQWTAKDDKIEVGDEVKHDRGWTAVVTQVDESGLSCIDKFGAVASYSDISRFSKTDRHFDIDKILEEMRYDG